MCYEIDKHWRNAWLGSVRVLKLPTTGAKRSLLDAAERLVVEHGFEAVSVRDVTGAVKANVAAVNYHFGSREGLMDLVMLRVLEPLCEERMKALEKARQRSGKLVPVEDAVAAFSRSLLTASARLEMERSYFLRLAGRILVLNEDQLAPVLAEMRTSVQERYKEVVAKSLPEIPAKELSGRWEFFEAGLTQSLVTIAPQDDIDSVLELWIGFGVRGLGAATGAGTTKPDDTSQGLLFDF